MIGEQLVASDSTKLCAQNLKKNNFNPKKIEQHIAHIDRKLKEYSKILASEDKDSMREAKRTEILGKMIVFQN